MKKIKFQPFIIVGLTYALSGAPLLAAPPNTVPWEMAWQTVQKRKPSRKKSAARGLAQAWQAYRAKNYASAKTQAGPFLKDAQFGDLARWVQIQAQLESPPTLAGLRQALKSLLEIEERYPSSPLLKRLPEEMAEAEVMLATLEAQGGKFKDALSDFEKGFQRYTNQSRLNRVFVPQIEAYAKACRSVKTSFCAGWAQRLMAQFTRSSPEYQALAQGFPEEATRSKPALPSFARLTATYRSPDLDQTSFDDAWSKIGGEGDAQWKESQKSLRQFLDEYPKSAHRYRARFWLGHALHEQGSHDAANEELKTLAQESPLTFYGLMAGIESGLKPLTGSQLQADSPEVSFTDPALSPAEIKRLERAEALVTTGAYELASLDLREFKSRDALSSSFLAYVALLSARAENFTTAFSLLGELIQRGVVEVASPPVLDVIFAKPNKFWSVIQKTGQDQSVDPRLLLSLIKQESAFDAEAFSISGAMGLMQLMPGTALDTDPKMDRTQVLEIDNNIRTGTKYFQKLLQRFKGNVIFALAGYNAGPGAVDRWIREGRAKKGMLIFMDNIPFKETREYVATILRNYLWYLARSADPKTPKTLEEIQSLVWKAPLGSTVPSPTPLPSPSAILETE